MEPLPEPMDTMEFTSGMKFQKKKAKISKVRMNSTPMSLNAVQATVIGAKVHRAPPPLAVAPIRAPCPKWARKNLKRSKIGWWQNLRIRFSVARQRKARNRFETRTRQLCTSHRSQMAPDRKIYHKSFKCQKKNRLPYHMVVTYRKWTFLRPLFKL